jgi:long-subunit fatty acid transport protein
VGFRARCFVLGLTLLAAAGLCRAQLIIGQYEDEAPFATWNVLGPPGAAASGFAGTGFALPLDATAAFANPALLTRLPAFSITASGSYSSAQFFKYAVINTGVASTQANLVLRVYSLDSVGASLRLGGWAIGLGYRLQEVYSRPTVDASSGPDYSFHFDQGGSLRVLSFSLARSLGSHFSLGVGLNLVSGNLDQLTEDFYIYYGETIATSFNQDFSGFFVNGGLLVDLTGSLRLAAVVRAPFVKKSDTRSSISRVIVDGRNFLIEGSSADEYREPLVAGLGLSYRISPEWLVACDVAYFNWSKYRVTFFGQDLKRDFRDVVRPSLGIEYETSATFLGWDLRLPFRVGIALDPQPMKNPRSTYFNYAFGTGLYGTRIHLDLAFLSGTESGSGRSLEAKRFIASLGVVI